MKKKIFAALFTVSFILSCSTVAMAGIELKDTSVSYIKEQSDGEYCIDLEEAYKSINDESKALTGKDNSIDASKKANTLSSLVNIYSILGGNEIFCIKDEEMAANTNLFKDRGILGALDTANSTMLVSLPTVNVVDHLAQTFVPGYGNNNSTMAEDNCPTGNSYCEVACNNYQATDYVVDCPYGDCPEIPSYFTCMDTCCKSKPNTAFYQGKSFTYYYATPVEKLIKDEEEKVERCNRKIEKKIVDKLEEQKGTITLGKFIRNFGRTSGELVYKKYDTGYGYLQAMNIAPIWSKFRDIAYLFYVVILIVIGFMIMFRNKIGGQVLVSIGNSIPQVIVGLVLVTFSFAIVGLALDIGKTIMIVSDKMFAGLYSSNQDLSSQEQESLGSAKVIHLDSLANMTDTAVYEVNVGTGVLDSLDECKDMYTAAGVDQGGTGLIGQVGKIVGGGIVVTLLNTAIKTPITDATGLTALAKLGGNLVLKGIMLPFVIGLIYNIIILLVCAYASFKLFLTMFTTYIKIFLNVILGPLQILSGSIPGNSSAVTNWLKSVIANVLVFPAIFIVINFAVYLGYEIGVPDDFNYFGHGGSLWPSFIANIRGVILIGAYFFASNIPGVINGFLKVGASKEMAAAGESTKKAATKLPLIGGMFG
ncbi:MAG: hypothetical protein ACOX6Q_03485 [Candidatus Dojkabacteria bacterium]|jgi:hypothetical protein